MAAKNNRFRPVCYRLPVGVLGVCALLVLAAFVGSPSRSRAQSTPAQQPAPSQPATQQVASRPAKPASEAKSEPAKSQKTADSDDDKWPEPEWETQQNPAGAPAATTPQPQTPATTSQPQTPATTPQPQTPATTPQAQTPATVDPASPRPAPNAQPSSAPPQQNLAATPPTQPAVVAAPTEPRPPYPGMTPQDKNKQQVAQECADLLKLATDLKAQVDKARKDELSVTVVRKATELEQMAHKVRSGTTLSTSNEKAP